MNQRQQHTSAPSDGFGSTGSSGVVTTEDMRVSARSSPNSVAGALMGVLRQDGVAHVQVVGAGALNQAIKAVAIARLFRDEASERDIVCLPSFTTVEIEGEKLTAIRLEIRPSEVATAVAAEDRR